jgi:hypothetical protein
LSERPLSAYGQLLFFYLSISFPFCRSVLNSEVGIAAPDAR